MNQFIKYVQEAKQLMGVSSDTIEYGRNLINQINNQQLDTTNLDIFARKAIRAAILHDYILPRLQNPQQAADIVKKIYNAIQGSKGVDTFSQDVGMPDQFGSTEPSSRSWMDMLKGLENV